VTRRTGRPAPRGDRPLLFLIGAACALFGIALVADGSGALELVAVGLMAAGSLALSTFIVLRTSAGR
jgi:hypothetical protein